MNKKRYETYTSGQYDLFIDNLKFLKDNVKIDKIRLRVPEIPKLHKANEINENTAILNDMRFEDIENFRYIKPEISKHHADVLKKKRINNLKHSL